MSAIIVKVSLWNFGITPGSEWAEVRQTDDGYELYVWNEQLSPDPILRGQFNSDYNWRDFAKQLTSIYGDDGHNVETGAAPLVDVEGEIGLRAEILRHAFACGESGMPDFVELLASNLGKKASTNLGTPHMEQSPIVIVSPN